MACCNRPRVFVEVAAPRFSVHAGVVLSRAAVRILESSPPLDQQHRCSSFLDNSLVMQRPCAKPSNQASLPGTKFPN